MDLKRHQILGKKLRTSLEEALECILVRGEESFQRRTQPGQIQQQFDWAVSIGDMVLIAVLEHLEYGPIANLPDYLKRGMDRSVEYFFGDWWKADESDARALDKSRLDRQLRWFEVLPNAMLLGGLTERWGDLARICSWFDATIQTEYQAGLIEDEYMQLFLCMASNLAPEPMAGVERILERVKACRAKRTKLLRTAWEAAIAGDQNSFDKAFKETVAHYLKADAQDVPNVCFWVALPQSTVWLIAERNGLKYPELPPELDAAVVRRQTIGVG